MAWLFDRTHKVAETSLSKFIRDASSADKKRVYQKVLKNATERQLRVIEEVQLRDSRAEARSES
jgi:hypothetical protein